MVGLRRHWNRLLNWLIPSRRARLLSEIMKADQESGLYDCCGDWDEYGICKCNKNIHGKNTETTE